MSLPAFACPAVLFIAGFGLRLLAYTQTRFANGWDAYYYLIQVKSWLESGRMHSPEASLIYPYFALLYGLSGNYVWMYQVGAALLTALFTLCLYGIFPRPWRFPIAAWSVFSPHIGYFAAQYPKNMLGVILFVLFIHAIQRMPDRRASLSAVALFFLNYLGHRVCFGLCVAFTLIWLLARLQQPSRKQWMGILLPAAVAAIVLAVLGAFLPGLLRWFDFERFATAFSAEAHFSPYQFYQTFGRERISVYWLMEIMLACSVFFISPLFHIKRNTGVLFTAFWPVWVLTALLLFPWLKWSYTDLSYRLFLLFGLLAPLLSGYLPAIKRRYAGFIGAVFLSAAMLSWKSYDPNRHDPDYRAYKIVVEKAVQYFEKNGIRPELLIAHHALAEYYTYTQGTDAMPWLPEYAVDSAGLWRIAAGFNYPTLHYFSSDTVVYLAPGYALLPEKSYQTALRRAKEEGDAVFWDNAGQWINPSRVRPGWILKRKK